MINIRMWDMDGRAAYFTSLVITSQSQSVKFESTFWNNCSSYLFPSLQNEGSVSEELLISQEECGGRQRKERAPKSQLKFLSMKSFFLAKITAFRKQKRNRAIKKILSKVVLFCFSWERDLYNTKIKNPLERHRPHSLVTCFWTNHGSWGAFTLGVTLCLGKL